MKRLLVAVALLWVVLTVFPGSRARVEPRLAEMRAWTWSQMEGPLSPILNKYRRVRAESELSEVSRLLVIQRNQGGRAPKQEDLPALLTRQEIAVDGLDPWGTPYHVIQQLDSVVVRSAGADLRHDSDDDLVVKVRFPYRGAPQRRFR